MVTISLCMIVKDEEDVLERCLEAASDIVDEIIIVDTGSMDKTKEIAGKFTDKIYDFEWIDDFSAARNFAFSKATKEYILWLDADDLIFKEDIEKFKELKNTLDNSVDSVTMLYNLAFDEKGNATFSLRRNRLVKRANNFRWIGFVHECLVVGGNVINSDIAISHRKLKESTDRNLRIYRKKIEEGVPFTLRDRIYYGNELFDNNYQEEAVEIYDELLQMDGVWFEDKINICGKISDYYYSKGNNKDAKMYSLQSFLYDKPRAEFCCRLGYFFLEEERYHDAIFWYELATKLERPVNCLGFINEVCWTWLPYLQLCLCYDRIQNHEKAFECNEMAASFVPENKSVLYNREYFKTLGLERG
ncbi:glycosyltransferase family 2 protein [Wukongibacter baidiensis]|uniref:glycosyltransferase n=1 Tax=Wukongibacter baidiensis TaxID=1723361 RepID=UPI003D7FFC75